MPDGIIGRCRRRLHLYVRIRSPDEGTSGDTWCSKRRSETTSLRCRASSSRAELPVGEDLVRVCPAFYDGHHRQQESGPSLMAPREGGCRIEQGDRT